ncbi:MAG: GNAT family N-acetyltransferase [Planctomycetota bacterium]|jgi:predicted acetyltransferase
MSESSITISAPDNDGDIGIFGEILSESLRFPPREEFDWATRIGWDNMLIARSGSEIAGGAMLVRMGQFFGGRSVPMAGIHGVAVSPEYRGLGVGSELMAEIVRSLHREGVPISVLYPATQPIYRKAGYEQAGQRIRYGLPRDGFESADRSLAVEKYQASHESSVRELYRSVAAAGQGNIDRNDWNWERITRPRGVDARGYVVLDDERVVGYAFFANTPDSAMPYYRIDMSEVLAATPTAAARIFSLFADHRSMITGVTWYGSPADTIAMQMKEQCAEPMWRLIWMLRIIDVAKALAARGYPLAVSGELHMQVDDELIPENRGNWTLTVENGEASIEPGGRGELRIPVRGLASLYAGYVSASQLAHMGLAEGDMSCLRVADAIFAGPVPWMVDMF